MKMRQWLKLNYRHDPNHAAAKTRQMEGVHDDETGNGKTISGAKIIGITFIESRCPGFEDLVER
jgi:hypothetical protein